MMMNKFISIDSATVIITIIMSLTSTLWAVVLPTASAADDNSSSCKVARYGFALNSDLQELQANFNELSTSTGPLLLKLKTLTDTVTKLQSQLNAPPTQDPDIKLLRDTIAKLEAQIAARPVPPLQPTLPTLPPSARVAFHVQRSESFSKVNVPIPYNVIVTNNGNGMNRTTGTFTAPVTGLYFFAWNGLAQNKGATIVSLLLNDYRTLGSAFGQSTNFGLNIHAIVDLKKDDQVAAKIITGPTLYDNDDRQTNFIGMLLG